MISSRITGNVVWLTVLWILLWGSLSVANVLSGLLVATTVLALARLPRLRRRRSQDTPLINPLVCVWFVVHVLYNLVQANLQVAWELITPSTKLRTGIVAVALRTESEMAMMVVTNVIGLSPGTMTVDVIGSPPVIYVHVLHLNSLEQIRRDLMRLEELSVRAFGSRHARYQLAERSPE